MTSLSPRRRQTTTNPLQGERNFKHLQLSFLQKRSCPPTTSATTTIYQPHHIYTSFVPGVSAPGAKQRDRINQPFDGVSEGVCAPSLCERKDRLETAISTPARALPRWLEDKSYSFLAKFLRRRAARHKKLRTEAIRREKCLPRGNANQPTSATPSTSEVKYLELAQCLTLTLRTKHEPARRCGVQSLRQKQANFVYRHPDGEKIHAGRLVRVKQCLNSLPHHRQHEKRVRKKKKTRPKTRNIRPKIARQNTTIRRTFYNTL